MIKGLHNTLRTELHKPPRSFFTKLDSHILFVVMFPHLSQAKLETYPLFAYLCYNQDMVFSLDWANLASLLKSLKDR